MKKTVIYLLFSLPLLACSKQPARPVYQNPHADTEMRIEDLLARMTTEEKIMQTTQWTYGKNMNENNVEHEMKAVSPMIGSLIYRSPNPAYRNRIMRKAMESSRLGIPILCGFDVIHGYKTIFPIPLAQSCSWDTELIRESCGVAARESKLSGVDWTFSPMVDVARDARWGRVAEGYGEDPYANAMFGAAAIRGYQGDSLTGRYSIAACLKHYVGYSMSEGGRDYNYTDISPQTLWETFMPPFEQGVRAGCATVMSAFNDISGTPASANRYTLTEVLKKRWAHDGFVVSDWNSIEQLIPQGVAADGREACLKAFMAGVEMDMVDDIYLDNMASLIDEGKIPMNALDEAVRRILRVKFRLGLFDRPYLEELPDAERFLLPEYLDLALRAAQESMVLLKNENGILPLKKPALRIALMGPCADDPVAQMGSWEGHGDPADVRTILYGMREEFGDARITYVKGCGFEGDDTSGFAEAVHAARNADVAILCMGEMKNWSGENASRSSLALPAIQERFVEAVRKAGKPVVLVLMSGRPLELVRLEPLADAIIAAWQPGTMGGPALASIVSGGFNPSARLSITFPLTTGQQPIHYNRRQSSRPNLGHYQDIPREPLYAFGHGLSYTAYEYSEISIPKTRIGRDETLTATIEVSNTGPVDGRRTILWFISDPVSTISRPVKELKYFEKKSISASGRETYTFEIVPMRDLSYADADGNRILEPGEFIISAGSRRVKFELAD